MILFIVSFLAGVLTILAPCSLPVLPVIVGGSVADGRAQPKKIFTIVISLGISIILFTLLLKASTLLIEIPQQTWPIISGGIILIFGLVTIFPRLWKNKWLSLLNRKSNTLVGQGTLKKSFIGDVVVGAALGPVFSTCSPTYFIVLATVLPVNIFLGLLYILSYVLGLGLVLVFVALLGQRLVQKLGWASNPNGAFKKILGVIFVLVGLSIMTGLEKDFEAYLISSDNFFDITQIEQKLLELTN